MSIDLTKVFDLKHNVFIEACAGAGKTWLLSKRYAAIMDEFARQLAEDSGGPPKDSSNILVITFTRKAAAEMSGRIYEDLNQLLNDQPIKFTPPGFGSHLRKASKKTKMHFRSTYSKNAISTIDSFCAQVLREQAEILDIDPEFRIQDEADTQRMELETWESFLREQSRSNNPDLKYLLEHLSIYHLNEYVKKLKSNAQLLKGWLDHQASKSPADLQVEYATQHPLPPLFNQLEKSLIALVDGFPASTEVENPQHPHYLKLHNVLDFLGRPIKGEYSYGLDLLEIVRGLVLTSDGNKYMSRVSIPSKLYSPEWKSEISQRLKLFYSKVQDLFSYEDLTGKIPSKWDYAAGVLHHHLANFFLSYWDVLNQRLKREGVLSFDEVILQARQVLQDPKVASHYGQRFSHILFDEFQDTNDLRWDIVRLIAQGGKENPRKQGLFIVGDTKQSIYRFNQADVQVMNRVRTQIEAGGGWILTADETYRSSARFVHEVINPLVTASFPNPEETDNIELYETVFRPTSAAKSSQIAEDKREISRCTVSAVLEDDDSKGYASDIYRTADLAQEWLEWVRENSLETDSGPQVGILLRSFSHILEYIRVFTARGLEFEVLSSKGLFAQQESYDIYHLLSVLVNPLDDLALVGLLRSPFFVIQDADIQKMREDTREHNSSGWVWNGLSQSHPAIIETIRTWQQDSARSPIDRLLTQIIGGAERRLGWISETGGSLRLANIDRLILMIHQLSLDGLGLREIQEYFKFQIQHGDASQAELPGAAHIQILTIHKAKGLEFPVVLLPGMQSPSPAEKSGIFLGRQNDKWQAGVTLDTIDSSHSTQLFNKIKAQTKAEEEAEDMRLFYVAVTRAKFGIGFIARVNPSRQPASNTRWKKYLTPVYDLELDKELALNDPQALKAEWKDRSSQGTIYDLTLGSELMASQVVELPSTEGEITSPEPASKALIYEEISPHTIMTWMDQQSYAGSDERQLGEDLGLETSALTFGRLLHRAMEMEWFEVESHAVDIKLFLEDEGIIETEAQELFLTDLTQCLDIYRGSTLAQKISGLSRGSKLPELPVFCYLRSETRIYKVSGIIDLLYQENEEWVVLDYKTDRELPDQSTLHQHAYWYQIQTYLWILKNLYGITARGELYFNRFDKIISITFEENTYFNSLSQVEHGQGLRPFLPSKQMPSQKLQEILERLQPTDEILLIEPTKNSGEGLAQGLARLNLNHPRLQIMTLGELRKITEPAGRRLTPYLARLGVAQLLGKKPQWGVVNRVAEAFYKVTQGESLVVAKEEQYVDFITWCEKQSIIVPGQDSELKHLPESLKIIVNSFHSTSPSDYNFLMSLSDQRDLIFLDPLKEGAASSGFKMSIDAWSSQEEMPSTENTHTYTSCYSTYEEVELAASEIRQLLQSGTETADIQIAVSSMERYVPAIKRVFDQVGISVRLSKREPVMERPVTQLALTLIQGRLSRQLSWDMAMSVWLHPLVIPSGAEGYMRLKLDIEMRKMGLTGLDESLPDLISHPKLNQAAKDLIEFASNKWQVGKALGLIDAADWLMELLKEFNFTSRLDAGSVASKSYTSLKNAILGIRNDWERYLTRKGSLGDFKRELKERLKGVEVTSAQQGFGIDVISLLDTLNLSSGHLFVLGMTEGQFPIATDINPHLKPSVLNPWFLNLYLFKQWLKRPVGYLHLTAPLHNADGAVLQESTFCQYLAKKEYPHLPAISLDQQHDTMVGKRFSNPDSPHQIRHNELQQQPGMGAWYGKLLPHEQREFSHISASAFDELIKCPQRYWYSRKLYLEPAETNIAQRQEIEVGNLVHQVLENFGKADGFLLAIEDFASALDTLRTVALELLKEQEIELEDDLIQSKWGELYFTNFHDPTKNLITAMLQVEKDSLKKFGDGGLHEQAFGDSKDEASWPAYEIEGADIKLSLRGKIDRVLLDNQNVWATDYKTGIVNISDSREFWTSQMLFYYLVLKSRYPDKNVVLTYEQIKGFKDNAFGFKGHLGDLESDNPVLDMITPRSKAVIPIADDEDWSVDRIKSETLAYAQALVDNDFPLTSRDEGIACAYCPFDRICRKTALPR